METNLILNTDSYKPSHWLQYPKNTENVYYYIESRGSEGDKNVFHQMGFPLPIEETVFFGLQGLVKSYLLNPITKENIEEAESILMAHGEPFYKYGWQYIHNKYGGYLPLEIRAPQEGLVIPNKNALVTVVNTDPKAFWLGSYIETMLLRGIWYPTTVATVSYRIKKIIKEYLDKTADSSDGLLFKLHDFGARGVSSNESSAIGGGAHLVNFMGSDTIAAIKWLRNNYSADMPAYSIPAAEHSSITTWGREREDTAYSNMLDQFAKPGKMVAVVSDSYDINNAVRNIWGDTLKQKVLDSGATVIIRPDSGDPVSTVVNVLKGLADRFGFSVNTKGYKVLNPSVRVIQGDGIDEMSIRQILSAVELNDFSTDNLAFGMGGALLQHMNRDTLKFAMKASAAKIDGKWVDVYKDPVGDKGKASKRGRVTLVKNTKLNQYYTSTEANHPALVDCMEVVFKNGELIRDMTLDQVRNNAKV